MEYEIKDKAKSQKEIEVIISPDEMEKYLEKAAKKLSSETEIKGFRPGKAPINIVKEVIGEERVWHEASNEAINGSYPEIVRKEKIDVISSPEIEIVKIEVNQPLIYKASVAVLPEIKLPDYKEKAKKVTKDRKEIEVNSKEVEKAMDTIRKSRAKTIKVSREARKDDEAILNFQGKIDGIAQEGLKGEKMPIIIGETKFIEGFEEKIIGMKEGEKKTFSLRVPFTKDSEKEVEFDIEVLAVNEKDVPKADDEFAKSLGDFSDINDLSKKIEENIKMEKEDKERERIRVKIIETISEDSSAEIPEVLIDRETDNMLHEFKDQFSRTGGSFEEYLKKSGKDENQIKKEWKKQAEKRILASLILQEIAKKESIEVSNEELENEATTYLNRIGDESARKNIDVDQLKLYIKDIIQNNKVFEMLESL